MREKMEQRQDFFASQKMVFTLNLKVNRRYSYKEPQNMNQYK